MADLQIEVYECKEGAARPGTREKARETCIDFFEVPTSGTIPVPGDIIMLPDYDDENGGWPVRYRVIEREHLTLNRRPEEDSQTPLRYGKMWIHVRKLTDDDSLDSSPSWTP